ncbi:thioesterase II family protein [Pseudomonas sp. FEN]|uniref:thioesterase II family protein n=1 Tax=Pseudomonas sp. FEN TaxID=2767468 RepID=UPI00174B37CA|nr:alpha/beta fold hydrolase [Pseudomonas sp. FEN]
MDTPAISLICFPHAGGSNATYNGWGPHLSESIQRIKLDAFDRHALRATFTEIDSLSSHIVRQLANECRPVALYGHSMGAILAYEVACKLSNLNTVALAHLFVSGRRAPQLAARLPPVHELPDQAFLQALIVYGGVPEPISGNGRVLGTLLPSIRSDLALVETYRFQPMDRLNCPISAIYATQDPVVERGELKAWQERTTGGFAFHELEGDHFFHSSRPEGLIDIIHRSLSSWLQEA